MDDGKDCNPFILDKINDFVWESFDEVLSYSSILYRVDGGVPCDEIQSGINLQEKIIPQSSSLIFIPGVSFFQIVFSLRSDNDFVFHCLLTILL